MRIASCLLPLWLCVATQAVAQSEEPSPQPKSSWREQLDGADERPPGPPVPPPREWYGWQVMSADGLALVLLVVSGIVDTPEIGTVGAGFMVAGPPVIHLANQRYASAAISFGMRAAAMALTIGTIVAVVDDSVSGPGDYVGVLGFGAVVSWIVTWIVDPAVLSFHAAPESRSALTPWVEPERGRAGLRFTLRL